MTQIKVGDKVIYRPQIPGLEDLSEGDGVVTETLGLAYLVRFGNRHMMMSDVDLEVVNE